MSKKDDMLAFALFDTSLGWMGVVGSARGLKRVVLPQKSKELVDDQIISCGCASGNHDPACFGDLPDRLRRYLDGEPVAFADKLDMAEATNFQQSVWQVVRNIPYGETRSYGWVAKKLDSPKAPRAVGQALARNPMPIVIPCHRVIDSTGNLGGFGGGVEIKEFLLCLERVSSINPLA
ncbi:MAG: methylated-DNA--[protein]-cysteine S-methyltransferase [Chloroflexi bacterium]|nr:methylated-DNA--[protein]-cysteine S-methyltransferase [Chloroflexota bacterium]